MNFVAIDVETTGTLPHIDHIVELAGVRFSAGKVVGEGFCTLINPGVLMPQEASEVNKITDGMLKDQPKIEEVLEAFSRFCGKDPLVAHNALFDFQFLTAAVQRHYKTPPSGCVLDTYALSKKVFPGLSNYKLSTVAQYLKVPTPGLHRAREDATICGHVFEAILQKMNISPGSFSPARLMEFCGKKELRFPVPSPRQITLF